MTLSQKETMLLQDLKSHEKLCVDKYAQYSSEASDSQLKNLFSQIGQTEQNHLNTIEQIMSGTVPTMSSSSGGSQGSSSSQQQSSSTASATSTYSSNSSGKQRDQFLCSDILATEKHVSSVYDTSIFEFKDDQVRNALNHIQKEEQQHGKQIYDFMSANGMYS
ncbi:spore coat protein [Oscillospiraceae bacterium LTW-04]|nr:spore coat protein [Oscillospiraceae bacterium MB24-C1]